MKQDDANLPDRDLDNVNNSRREFLRNSVYAAYATPLIAALLVEEASAASSNANVDCDKTPWNPNCQ
jgi:hypothetical protein